MGSEEDSGNKQGPSPKSPVQSSKHTAPSSCHIPSSHRPCLCLALPTQEVISSCCLAHQVAPAHAPVLRQRASAGEALQDPHLCDCRWGYLVAGRLALQTAGFLRAEHRPAWLLSPPHHPSFPWPPAEDVALRAPRSPHRQVAVSLYRDPGFSAAVPEALWGAEWDFQRSCFWVGKMFGGSRARLLNEWCCLMYM